MSFQLLGGVIIIIDNDVETAFITFDDGAGLNFLVNLLVTPL